MAMILNCAEYHHRWELIDILTLDIFFIMQCVKLSSCRIYFVKGYLHVYHIAISVIMHNVTVGLVLVVTYDDLLPFVVTNIDVQWSAFQNTGHTSSTLET